MEILLIASLGLISGLSIGCIGIGGVILVPGLFYLAGIPIQTAIAAAMMGYLLTGLVGTVVYAGKKSINWSMAGWLCAGAMPAAVAGAWLSNNIPGAALEFVIGLLTVTSGVQALKGKADDPQSRSKIKPSALVAIGVLTGVLSAITGTGGPLVLVPLMLWLKTPVLTAIGLSQAVQLPIAALATAGNFAFGTPDVTLGAILAVALAIGSYAGAQLAHKIPQAGLKKLVASVLIAVGTMIILKIVSRLV
ncbi:MAG: sulfite exporter TauE/SafE family protein [Alphaproteobacteria bacterium]|nr:sulfite exporter TauE/SafE family protein [Alphaproteobacteria bacterium]